MNIIQLNRRYFMQFVQRRLTLYTQLTEITCELYITNQRYSFASRSNSGSARSMVSVFTQ